MESRARQYTLPYREVGRAKMIPLDVEGRQNNHNKKIAELLYKPRPVVNRWRRRFCEERLAGLEDRPRGDRPSDFSPRLIAEVKALVCELPAKLSLPLSRFSRTEFSRHVLAAGQVAEIGGTTILH